MPGTLQRRDVGTVSSVDLRESYQVGANAARLALAGETGYMSTIIREPGQAYAVRHDKVELDVVANAERKFPAQWIAPDRVGVTDGYVRWATPLLGEPLPRFSHFTPKHADAAGLPPYTPQAQKK